MISLPVRFCLCGFFLLLNISLAQPERSAGERLTLQEAFALALENNFDLRQSRLDVSSAAAGVDGARGVFDPTVSVSGFWQEQQSARAGSILDGADQPSSDGWQANAEVSKRFSPGTMVTARSGTSRTLSNSVNALLDPDYSSDIGLRVRQPLLRGAGREVNLAPLRRARLDLHSSQAGWTETLVRSLAEVETAYWSLAAATARLELSDSALALAETILARTKREQEVGLATRTDWLEAQANLSERREDRIRFGREVADAAEVLSVVLGIDPSLKAGEVWQTEPMESPDKYVPERETVRRSALEFSPSLQAQMERIRRDQLDLVVSRNERRPDLSVILSGDYLGREEVFRDAYERALRGDGYRWSAGLEISFPWGNRDARAREAQSRFSLRQSEISQEALLATLGQEINAAIRRVEAGWSQLQTARASVALRAQIVEAEEARRREGLADMSDVLLARRNLDQARLREVEGILEVLRGRVQIARLDGSLLERAGLRLDEQSVVANARGVLP